MDYKKMAINITLADLALESFLKHNRNLKLMQKMDSSINWAYVEHILLSCYTFGHSGEGAEAYPPLMLIKCMLLQNGLLLNASVNC